jgi:hypothetical protein
MTQSKKELAERNARIRAEKLRENLARRKQQNRERASKSQTEPAFETNIADQRTDKNSAG